MIGFFPDPYPDELFYSICARYSRRVGYHSYTHATYDLFGARILVAIALPSNLNHLISALPPGHRYTVDRLIDAHTLLPFYAPFLPQERVVKVRENMAEDSGGKRTHSLAGVLFCGNSQYETFRYCPACVTEDRRRYGEAYWHRAHQAPRVIVCPHHAVWLEPSDIYLHFRDRRKSISTAEEAVGQVPARLLSTDESDHQIHLWIAREAQWLLDHPSGGNPPEELRARYHNLLFTRSLATYSGVVSMRKLQSEIRNFYSDELLAKLHSRLDLRSNWLLQLLLLRTNSATAHQPIHHLLMMRFLGCTVAEFLQVPTQPQPFGPGPWPCLNPVCKRYQELCIEAFEIRPYRLGPQGKVVVKAADFRCECGFTYSRRVPDPTTESDDGAYWVKSRGTVWEEALRQLSSSGKYTSRELGQKLGVKGSLIRSKVAQIKQDWEATKQTRARARAEARLAAKELKRAECREQMLQAMKENPTASRSELARLVPIAYGWLFEHDREWVEASLPPPRPHIGPPARIDWNRRDAEFAAEARTTAERLKQAPGRPVRVSKILIAREIGALPIIFSKAHHLPLTKAVLEEVSESLDDWAARRIQWAAECFRQAGGRPTSGQVLKRAVVTRKKTRKKPSLQAALDAAMRTFETQCSKR
jgi:Tn7-like transposition protein D/TniQ protein